MSYLHLPVCSLLHPLLPAYDTFPLVIVELGKEESGRSLSEAELLTISFFLILLQELWTRQRKKKSGKFFLNQMKHFILIIGYFSGGLLPFNAQQYKLVTALFAFQLVQSIPCGISYSLYLCVLHYNYGDNSANMKAFSAVSWFCSLPRFPLHLAQHMLLSSLMPHKLWSLLAFLSDCSCCLHLGSDPPRSVSLA